MNEPAATNPVQTSQSPHPLFHAYMYLVIFLGLASLAFSLYCIPSIEAGYGWLFILAIAAITGSYCITIPSVNSKISIGDSLFFTNLILTGIPAGILTQAVQSLAASCRAKNKGRRFQYLFFNVASTSLSAHISGIVFYHLMKRGPLDSPPKVTIGDLFVPLGVLAIVHYLANSGTVSMIVALEKRRNPYVVWKESFLWTSITYFIGATAAGFIALSIGSIEPQIFIILVIVLLVVYFTYKTYLDKVAELERLKLSLEGQVKQRTQELEKATERAILLADAAEAASRAKSNFLATMSHEIRTPLNAVIGYSEMLQEEAVDLGYPQLVPDLCKIGSAGKHLLSLINDILDFSKIEVGMLKLSIVQFNPYQSIDELIQLYAGPAQEKGLPLVCFLDERVPQKLLGDPDRLRQILTNLIGNAIKFTEKGKIAVSIHTINENPVLLRFEVKDTGIGIPTESQTGIFQAFSQADGSTSRKYGGTGLGLAIVKQLAGMMGGEVGIHSESGKGSTFWFTACFQLPLDSNAQEPAFSVRKHRWRTGFHSNNSA